MAIHNFYLQTAQHLLQAYRGPEPFALYLKNYFAQHKQMGSRDRKYVSNLCYGFLRLCHVFQNKPDEGSITKAYFLLENEPDQLVEKLLPENAADVSKPFEEKLSILHLQFQVEQLFPWVDKMGDLQDNSAFLWNLLKKPNVFLRVRPGKHAMVEKIIKQVGLPYTQVNGDVIALPNNATISNLPFIGPSAIIQDWASRQTGNIIVEALKSLNKIKINSLWDTCAASGGKSIMLSDALQPTKLFATDIRSNILHNLKNRFKLASIQNYTSMVLDVSKKTAPFANKFFDIILCDVPCTGSGTWSRTPENMYTFNYEQTAHYVQLQRGILINASKHKAANGIVVYITCSVFKDENEHQVEYLLKNTNLKLYNSCYIEGANKKADTMFISIFN